MAGRDDLRPFIRDGDPLGCQAFIVGFNPASQVPFLPFWDDRTGFDQSGWQTAYQAARIGRPTSISPTRRRIKAIVERAQPFRILETNLYARATQREADLRAADRNPAIFDFLLREIAPRVVLVHGRKAKQYFESLTTKTLTEEFQCLQIGHRKVAIAAVPHLASPGMSNEKAGEIGIGIQAQLRKCGPGR